MKKYEMLAISLASPNALSNFSLTTFLLRDLDLAIKFDFSNKYDLDLINSNAY